MTAVNPAPEPNHRPDVPDAPDTELHGVQLPDVAVGTPNPYRGARRFLVFASGANPHVLAASPTEQNVYMGMGALVCSTATMAAISMTVAMTIAFDLPFALALPMGVFWGLVIFNLDRWFVTAQSNDGTRATRVGSFIGRLFLAAAFGYIIAEPLILKVFDQEIQAEVQTIVADRNEAARAAFNSGPDAARLAELEAAIVENREAEQALRNRAANVETEFPRPVASDYASAAAQDLQTKIDETIALRQALLDEIEADRLLYEEANRLREAEEFFGAPEQDRPAGCGPVCRDLTIAEGIALARWEETVARNQPLIDQYTTEINDLRTRLNETPPTRGFDDAIEAWEALIDQRRAEYSADADDLQREREDALLPERDTLAATIAQQGQNVADEDGTGLLIQMEALERVAGENSRALFFRWALTVLLVLVEALPVLGKFLYSLSGDHPYDRLSRAIDRRATLTAHTLEVQASRDLYLLRHGLADRSRLAAHAEATVQRHAIERSVGIHRAMVDQLLDDWAEENGVSRDTPPMRLDDLQTSPIPVFEEQYEEPEVPNTGATPTAEPAPTTAPPEPATTDEEDTADGAAPAGDDDAAEAEPTTARDRARRWARSRQSRASTEGAENPPNGPAAPDNDPQNVDETEVHEPGGDVPNGADPGPNGFDETEVHEPEATQ